MSGRQYNYKGRQVKSTKPSKSQRKREAYNYRSAYFRKNPGLFGFIWFCSQCGIPMFGKENVQVDHIIPLAGMGINRTINTVAICPKCNRAKSDKGGKYVIKGMFAKVIETILFTLQKVSLYILILILRVLHYFVFGIIRLIRLPLELFGFNSAFALIAIVVLIIILFN